MHDVTTKHQNMGLTFPNATQPSTAQNRVGKIGLLHEQGTQVDFSQWLLFVVSTFLISATPGPNMLLAFQYGLNYGFKKTMWTLAGLTCGLTIWLVLSISGVAVLSQKVPVAFEVFKCLGALYLAYLGWQAWQSKGSDLRSDAEHVVPTPAKLFRMGVAVALSNPKAILFFAAFFPKFVDASLPQAPQYLVLTVSFFVIETVWQLIYTVSGKALAAWLQQGRRLQNLNRVCGAIFILIALSLLWDSMHTLLG